MSLTIGTRLGHYEIVARLGEGGMGEVYRGKDTRLDRSVAIKVLRDMPGKEELAQRFEREARIIAALNHPHICTLYDVGRHGDVDYLVMEFVDGETLTAKLEKGALPIADVLRYAIEIADALDKAHRQGVTHRDLKPANIMLTKSGTKLLDFGLAKLKPTAQASSALSALPTNAAVTADGTILGTLQYMAPEQLEGQEADARADIFAFGAVLYEMATGRKTFEGKSHASLIAAILDRDPPSLSSLQPAAPPHLDHVVERCLAKAPDDRWQAASDLHHELKWIADHLSHGKMASQVEARPEHTRGRRAMPIGVAALIALIAGAIVGATVWTLKPATLVVAPSIVRLTVAPPPGEQLAVAGNMPLALSPDGTLLAYVSGEQLHLRAMDNLTPKPLPGTEGAAAPFFSPDGQWIGFFAQSKLKKVSVTGGTPQILCDAAQPMGGSWGSDDIIFFSPSSISGVRKVSASGGKPEVVTVLDRKKGEVSHRWPHVLPGGKAVLFTVWVGPGWDERQLQLLALDTGARHVLVPGAHTGRYVASGHLVYSRAGVLTAVPFDLARLAVTGPPISLTEQVRDIVEGADLAVSESGVLAYVPGSPRQYERRLVWLDRKGTVEPLPTPLRAYEDAILSPDGRAAAATISGTTWGIWIYDLVRATLSPVTSGGSNQWPVWAPDGKRIIYRGTRSGLRNLYWKPTDGSGTEERLTTSDNLQTARSVTPEGKWLAFEDIDPSTGSDVWVLPLEGDRKPQAVLKTPFGEALPAFSTDGRWLAYVSDESGRGEIYVRPFPGPGGKLPISTEGASSLLWSQDGRQLYYVNGDKVMAVDVTLQPSFAAGTPRLLFESRIPITAVSLDGQRFLGIQPTEPAQAANQIDVVINWFEELKQRVPAGK